MAISDVLQQLQVKVMARDQSQVTQILQNAQDNLCLQYGLDLTATRSGMFDKSGNSLSIAQALQQIGAVVVPARLNAAVLQTLQVAVNAVPTTPPSP